MSNFHSFAGGAVWMTVATLLMLVTFEPVSIEHPQTEAAAAATGSIANA